MLAFPPGAPRMLALAGRSRRQVPHSSPAGQTVPVLRPAPPVAVAPLVAQVVAARRPWSILARWAKSRGTRSGPRRKATEALVPVSFGFSFSYYTQFHSPQGRMQVDQMNWCCPNSQGVAFRRAEFQLGRRVSTWLRALVPEASGVKTLNQSALCRD